MATNSDIMIYWLLGYLKIPATAESKVILAQYCRTSAELWPKILFMSFTTESKGYTGYNGDIDKLI